MGCTLGDRQRKPKNTAPAQFTAGFDRPPLKLDQPSTNGQPDASAARATIARSIGRSQISIRLIWTIGFLPFPSGAGNESWSIGKRELGIGMNHF